MTASYMAARAAESSRPVPAGVARAMGADVVIAVDITRMNPAGNRARQLEADLRDADVVIRPDAPRTRILDFAQKRAAIERGEAAARAALPASTPFQLASVGGDVEAHGEDAHHHEQF